jgi:hypothetical protein
LIRIYLKVIYSILIGATVLSAQSRPDSLSFLTTPYNYKMLQTNFDKQLSTYNLNSSFRYGGNIGKLFIGLNENFKSTIIRSSTKNIKDEQHLSVIGEYIISPKLSVGNLTNIYIYSDDRKLDINSASNINTSLYARIKPYEKINIIPFAGPVVNKLIGTQDNGILYGSEASINNLNFNEFNFASALKFYNEDISPRKNTFRFVKFDVLNNFENSFRNIITFDYDEQRMDFYFETDSLTMSNFNITNNIQSRIASNYYLQDRFSYLSDDSKLRLDFDGRIGWRNIDRDTRYISTSNIKASTIDTKVEEFRLDFASSGAYSYKNFNTQFRFMFSEKEEKHIAKNRDGIPESIFIDKQELESKKNNSTQLALLSGSGSIKFLSRHTISVFLFHRKLRYDTPSEDNFDDRDELLSSIKLDYRLKVNPFFTLFTNIEGSLNHIVYIFGERSSNNNLRRVLQLKTGGNYTGNNVKSTTSAEVSANYTVYDFEDINPNFQSFSFRQYILLDSTSISLTKRMGFDLYSYLKISEQGELRWSNFTGKPARLLQEFYLEPKLIFLFKGLSLGIGMRYFSLLTFRYTDDIVKKRDTKYSSIGPLSNITLVLYDKLNLYLRGWYELINDEKNVSRDLVNLQLKLTWHI